MPKRISPNAALRKVRKEAANLARDNHNLRESNTMHRELLKEVHSERDRLRDELDRAKDMMMPFSGLFSVAALDLDYMEPSARIDFDFRYDHPIGSPMMSAPAMEHYTIKRIPLDVMLTYVDKNVLSGVVHALVHFRGHKVGYAVSEATYRQVSRRHFERDTVEFISKTLARDLMNKLGK